MPQSLPSRALRLMEQAANLSWDEKKLSEKAARMLAGASSRAWRPLPISVSCTAPPFHNAHRIAQWLQAQILTRSIQVSGSDPISNRARHKIGIRCQKDSKY